MARESIAECATASGDSAQFGYDAVGGFVVAGIFNDPQLTLNAKPVHRCGLVFRGKASAFGALIREIRLNVQSPPPLSSYD